MDENRYIYFDKVKEVDKFDLLKFHNQKNKNYIYEKTYFIGCDQLPVFKYLWSEI
jgi:hypothetical protein